MILNSARKRTTEGTLPNHLTSFDATTTENQTVAFNIQARVDFKSRCRIWQAIEMTDSLVDESDPRGEDDRIISSSRKTQGHPLRLQTNAIPRFSGSRFTSDFNTSMPHDSPPDFSCSR
jgi:hypothetical protein